VSSACSFSAAMTCVHRIYQLCGYAHPVCGFPYTAFEHITDAELAAHDADSRASCGMRRNCDQ
jgi:3-methyladenine DNA glycosylase/8-oxoguanine DNA glycosylase